MHERTLLDPNIQGYACSNGDVFYVTLIEQAGGIPIAATIRPPAMSDDIQILKFWLSDKHASERVPNQLAVLCRRMVEISEENRHVAAVADPFAFCPTCSEALVRFESDDVYMQGLRCSRGHEFWARGSTIYYVDRGVRANLSADLDDDYMPKLIEYYAGDNKHIKPYVHPQLRGVLQRFGT